MTSLLFNLRKWQSFPQSGRDALNIAIGSLKQRRFWATHVNRKWTFALLGAVVAPRSNTKREEASSGVIFTRARVSLAQLSLRENGGLLVV